MKGVNLKLKTVDHCTQCKLLVLLLLASIGFLCLSSCKPRESGVSSKKVTRINLSFEVKPELGYDAVFAEIFVNNELVGNVGNGKIIRFDLPSGGIYSIRLEAPGYKSVEKKVKLLDTSCQEFHYELRK